MAAGFIYVLINPAIPGLAKVGKTIRQPSERVAELSSATGVPSPFLIAYQQPVADCDAAEKWVHSELELGGYRHSEQREFFNAPLHVVIGIVSRSIDVRGIADQVASASSDIADQSQDNLANTLYDTAVAYDEGTDTVLQNSLIALKYYEQAAALGHAYACSMAGINYRYGTSDVQQDLEKALGYFKKSTSLGNWGNYAYIAGIFLYRGQKESAKKYWVLFFEAASTGGGEECDSNIRTYGLWYCQSVAKQEIEHCVEDAVVRLFTEQLLEGVKEKTARLADESDARFAEFQHENLQLIRLFIDELI